MAIVFVHGNPESEALWGPLLTELGRDDVVRLSPPGFGSPVPDGFGATVLDYRDWLIDELTKLGEPVHVIGHDWGGGHVVNVAMHRPDLLLSWTTDVLALFDPDYVWHDYAQILQTPGPGEDIVARLIDGTIEDRAARMAGLGLPADIATDVAAVQGPGMARCMLALYRSAAQPAMAELGRDLEKAAARPGLSLIATADAYGAAHGEDLHRRAAARAGARVAVLDGLGHWWMVEDPKRGADVIDAFLTEVGTG
ncbi:MAG TPA: alpha/beta fold hydrolase [Pseudonocardiaceae bacterium]